MPNNNVLIKIVESEIKTIISDYNVYTALSPLAYYVYLSLINSQKGFQPTMKWVDYLLRTTRKTSIRVVRELEMSGLLNINEISHGEYIWTIRYSFKEDKKKKMEKIIAKEKKDNSETIKEIERIEQLMDNSNGEAYEQYQKQLIELNKILRGK